MTRYEGRYQKLTAGCGKSLLGMALLFALCACGKQRDLPVPPQSPPRPVTSAGSGAITTAQFVISARPKIPPAGWM